MSMAAWSASCAKGKPAADRRVKQFQAQSGAYGEKLVKANIGFQILTKAIACIARKNARTKAFPREVGVQPAYRRG